MRTEAEVRTDLAAAKAAYQAQANDLPAAALRELAAPVRALQAELSDCLSAGAVPCPTCGARPHGMLRTPAAGRAPAIYEVGCLACPTAAQGLTPAQAVGSWNAGEYAAP